jgi:PAS domain S-box-containing protein
MEHYLKQELYSLIRSEPQIFDFLQSSSLDGLWYWDLEHPEHEWMSPRMWETLGYNPDQMPHSPTAWQDLIDPEDSAAALVLVQQHLADPEVSYDQIVRYRHSTGSTVWIRCRGIAIRDEQGTPLRMLGAHTDVTPIKEAELQLQQANQRLQERSEDLEQFALLASHDLKAPIRQIGSLAALLAEELDEQGIEDDSIRELVDLIVQRASRAMEMHRDLLSFATSGIIASQPEQVDLAALTEDLWASHAQAGFSLSMPEPLPTVFMQRIPLKTALTNLMSNVLHHHDRVQGCITVTASIGDKILRLVVADDGPGIPAEQRERAFEPFRTLKSSGGTGLGLAIVRKLSDRFGEGVVITDNAPRGTRIETRWHLSPPPS